MSLIDAHQRMSVLQYRLSYIYTSDRQVKHLPSRQYVFKWNLELYIRRLRRKRCSKNKIKLKRIVV
jgi:hypothetical protein